MSYRDWHVGMKVVCIDASPKKYDPPGFRSLGTDLNGLKEGRVYTVREVLDFYGIVGVRLQGIIRPLTRMGLEAPYAAARFRPVQKRSTSIEVFNKILLNPRIPIREDA